MEDIIEEEGKGNQKVLEDQELQVAHLKQKLTVQTEVNGVLSSKLQEAESASDGLRNKVDQKDGELSHMVEEHKVQGKQSSTFITELEEQLRVCRSEIKTLQSQKRDLEAQLGSRAVEAVQLDEKNRELSAQTSELEQVLKAKGDEIFDLLNKQKDNEFRLKSKIDELAEQFSILQLEVDRLRAREGEVEVSLYEEGNLSSKEVNSLGNQGDILQQGSESMHGREAELESKSKELSELQIQVTALKDELSGKIRAEQKMMKEKEALHMQVMDLESDVDSLHRQNNDLEEQTRSKYHENVELREENERLHAKILELEGQLSSKEDELSALVNREGEHLLGDVNQMKNNENSSDPPKDGERQEFSESLSQMEGENVELRTKIDELQKALAEKEAAMTDLVEEPKQFKRLSTESRLNYQTLERKLELLAEEFRKKLEDNIRLLFQRIQVAEKMHFENKENHTRMKETLEQENALLIEKLAAYEAEGMNLSDGLAPREKGIVETNDGKQEATENSISNDSNTETEVALAKTCAESGKTEEPTDRVAGREEQQLLLEKVRKLEVRLSKEEANKLNLMKVVSELKERVSDLEKDIEEKDKMMVALREEKSEAIRKLGEEQAEATRQLDEERREAIRHLEEEMREAITQLGEEKREAIRQLCTLMDHYRSRCQSLEQLVSDVSVRRKNRS